MNTCWKCGKPSGDEIECDFCAAGISPDEACAISHIRLARIDWAKVVTMEDMRELMSLLVPGIMVGPANYERMKKWLK